MGKSAVGARVEGPIKYKILYLSNFAPNLETDRKTIHFERADFVNRVNLKTDRKYGS